MCMLSLCDGGRRVKGMTVWLPPIAHILESVWGQGTSPKTSLWGGCYHLKLFNFIPIRMAVIKEKVKSVDEATGSLVHCWWEYKMVQMLWKAVWWDPQAHTGSSHYPAIQFWTHTHKNRKQGYKQILEHNIRSSVIHSEKWKQPKCLSTNEWINKIRYIIQWSIIQPYNGMEFWHVTAWMNLEEVK